MRRSIFEQLTFVCPVCRQSGVQSRLALAEVAREDQGFILEALIECTHGQCRSRFPIVAGIPIILRDLDSWWRGNRDYLTRAMVESRKLGDYFAELDRRSQTSSLGWSLVSTYLHSHYAIENRNQKFWQQAVAMLASEASEKPSLDLGCAVGRMTFELASISTIAVGLDLDFRSLVAALQIQKSGSIQFNRVRSSKRLSTESVCFEPRDNVLFLVADALDPPFPAEMFGTVSALNVLDNVSVPLTLIGQMDALLAPGGQLLMCSPYQWRPDIADSAQWLESDVLAAEQFVRAVLCHGAAGSLNLNYTIESETPRVDWTLIQNERQSRCFQVDLLVARKD